MTHHEPPPTGMAGAPGPARHRLVASRSRRRAPRALLSLAALGTFALAAAACGSSSPSATTTTGSPGTTAAPASSATTAAGAAASSASTGDTVKVLSTAQFGKILVNGSGMALYTYGPDHGGAVSACTGACIQAWPPLTVANGTSPHAGPGVTGTLATARQPDGALQVTYDGNLLYTFLSDSSPGQVTGNGVAGFSVAKAGSASAPPPPPRPPSRVAATSIEGEGADRVPVAAHAPRTGAVRPWRAPRPVRRR